MRLLNAGPNLVIQNLMIANCGQDGSIWIDISTSLTMENVTMVNCTSTNTGGCINGADGSVRLKNFIVDGCSSTTNFGAAIFARTPLLFRIENATFSCPSSIQPTTSIIRATSFTADAYWEFAGDIRFVGNRGTLIDVVLDTANWGITFATDPDNPANFIFDDNQASYGIQVRRLNPGTSFNMTFNSIIARYPSSPSFISLQGAGDKFTIKGNLIDIQNQSRIQFNGLNSTIEVKNVSISNPSEGIGITFVSPSTLICDTELRLRKATLNITRELTINAEMIDVADSIAAPFQLTGDFSPSLSINSPGPLRIYDTNNGAFSISSLGQVRLNVQELDIQGCSNPGSAAIQIAKGEFHVNADKLTMSRNIGRGALRAVSSVISLNVSQQILFEANMINGVTESGGAISLVETSMTMNASQVSFLSNSASGAGGALYLINASFSVHTIGGNTIFRSCRSSVDGGAIYANSSNLHFVTNSTIFELNSADVSGGALYLVEDAYAQFNESSYAPVFRSNRADIGGAVKIFGDVAQSYISNSSFYSNIAREGCFASFAETSTCPVFGGQIMSNRGLSPYRFSNCLEVDSCFSGCVSPPLTCAKCTEYQRWMVTTQCVESVFGSSEPSLEVSSPVIIVGNFTFAQIEIIGIIPLSNADAVITSNDCVEAEQIDIVLTDDDAKQLEGGRKLALISSTCQTNPKLSVVKSGNSCRTTSVRTESTEDNGRFTLNAVFTVDNKKCNRWWIILVSVLGGVILLGIVIFLLYRFTSFKTVIRPYASANS